MPNAQTESGAKSELRKALEELQRLRDEVRLKLHLGGMDARAKWNELEKRMELLEEDFGHQGDHLVETSRQIIAETRQSFLDLQRKLV